MLLGTFDDEGEELGDPERDGNEVGTPLTDGIELGLLDGLLLLSLDGT